MNMGVHTDCRNTETESEYQICGFQPHSRQRGEILGGTWNGSVMKLHDDPGHFANVTRFCAVEACREYE